MAVVFDRPDECCAGPARRKTSPLIDSVAPCASERVPTVPLHM